MLKVMQRQQYVNTAEQRNTLPIVNEDRIAKLFDRANERRRNSEFDDAMSIYENIIAEDSAIAEAYWGIVFMPIRY